jgi:2-dehydro-3-deoxygluconokinase
VRTVTASVLRLPEEPSGGHVVACVGETMACLVPPAGEALEAADALRLDIAGAESNVAMYLADHGVRARWVSRLGDDALGRRVLARVAAQGVDVRGVAADPVRPTGVLVKDPGPAGTRVTYYRRGSAASALTPAVLDEPAARTATLWHLTGITPALSPGCRALASAAPAAARAAGITLSFDVNHRPALWDREPAADVLAELADAADICFVGLDEARALWGPAMREADDVRALLAGPALLVVKDGARPVVAFEGERRIEVPARPVRVVEPVGAGDAFAAGVLAALLRGTGVGTALRSGHLTAGAALSVTGDHGPLPAREFLARMLAADETEWAGAANR